MNVNRAPRSRWLPAVLVIGLVLVSGFFAYRVASRTARHKQGDFYHFYFAGEAVNRGEDIYASGEQGYIYPPLLAVAISPLARLDPMSAERLWAGINGLLIAGVMAVSFLEAARRFEIPSSPLTFLAVSLAALLLTFEQVRNELEMGQTDTIVLLGFALGLTWLDRRPLLAGVALGLAANIKYQSLIVLPYLLLRRRYRAAGATGAAAVGWALLPGLVTGWETNLRDLTVAFRGLGHLVGLGSPGRAADIHQLTWPISISIPSAAARALEPLGAGPAVILGAVAIIAAGVAADFWVVYRRSGVPLLAGRTPGLDATRPFLGVVALEWYGLIVAALVFSPQTSMRHTVLLLSMNVLIAALILAPRVGVWRWPLIVGAAVFQLSTKLPPSQDRFEAALSAWRSVGGASWGVLVMYASLLWVGLAYAKAVAEGRPLVCPPGPDRRLGPVPQVRSGAGR